MSHGEKLEGKNSGHTSGHTKLRGEETVTKSPSKTPRTGKDSRGKNEEQQLHTMDTRPEGIQGQRTAGTQREEQQAPRHGERHGGGKGIRDQDEDTGKDTL